MTYNLIDSKGYLIKQFDNMKQVKKYVKDHDLKNYIILRS
jgi:hypothetical protein